MLKLVILDDGTSWLPLNYIIQREGFRGGANTCLSRGLMREICLSRRKKTKMETRRRQDTDYNNEIRKIQMGNS